MKKLFFIFLSVAVFAFIPSPAFAIPCYASSDGSYIGDYASCPSGAFVEPGSDDGGGSISNLYSLISVAQRIIGSLVPLVVGLAVLVILWGLFGYITHAGEEEKRAEARMFIIYGILGLFIMISIWGLVGIVSNTFKIQERGPQSVGSIFPN